MTQSGAYLPAARAETDAAACDYWAAPGGSNSNPGTSAQPWATLAYAAAAVPNGRTVCFKDGVYSGYNSIERRFTATTTFRAENPYRAKLINSGSAVDIHGAMNVVIQGFEITHSGPGASALVVQVHRKGSSFAQYITLRNNILHDSYNNDLLKLYDGVNYAIVEGNVFYNQGSGEEHMDVNGVSDVVIRDNIFFNDFAGSGRSVSTSTKSYITIKDSFNPTYRPKGAQRIRVLRNVFLNWQGASEPFIQVGNDGKDYFEAIDVRIENNLMLGNSPVKMDAAFGANGVKDLYFINNTITGDLPSSAYAFRINRKGGNPVNQNLYFQNNIWSDPTGTMERFSAGSPSNSNNLILDNNLYWNGGNDIPAGDLVSPLASDAHRTVADPKLNPDQSHVTLPRWSGAKFQDGSASIRDAFVHLVETYASVPSDSPAVGRGLNAVAPPDDILGEQRAPIPNLGAYEAYHIRVSAASDLTTLSLSWTDPRQPDAASQTLILQSPGDSRTIPGIPPDVRSYVVTDLKPYALYTVTLEVLNSQNQVLAASIPGIFLTTDIHAYLPAVQRSDW